MTSTSQNSNDSSLKYYVINLKSQPERRSRMAALLDAQGVDYEFFDAVYGKNLSAEEESLCSKDNQVILEFDNGRKLLVEDELSASEKGCALSHLKLYQKILDDGVERAVIMEDDLDLTQETFLALNSIDCIKESWDIINFSSHIGIKSLPFAKKYYFDKQNGYYFSRLGMRNSTLDSYFNQRRFLCYTALYVVTPKACRRLISLGYPVRITADYLTGIVAYHNLKLFRVYPLDHFLLFSEVDSSIGNRPAHKMIRL